ncbi:cyclin, C-terminal domain-containing protein, partial [Tanacetum coccineum]
IDFLEFRPSEIAAGVAIYVVGKTQMCALFQHVQKERILKCVELRILLKCVELVNELSGCTKNIKNGSGTGPHSPIGVLEAACLSYNKSDDSGIESKTTKRRRLDIRTPFHLEL